MNHDCYDCRHHPCSLSKSPCDGCLDGDQWEEIETYPEPDHYPDGTMKRRYRDIGDHADELYERGRK